MTLLTYPMQDNFETKLSQARNGATGTVYVQTAPSFTMPASSFTVVTVDPGTDKEQAFIMDSFNTSAKTLNCYSISVDKGPSLAYTQQSHSVGAKVIISNNYRNWKKVKDELDGKAGLADTNTWSGTQTFNGAVVNTLSWKPPEYADATARDAAIPSPSNGMLIYNTAAGLNQKYLAGIWTDDTAGGAVPNASLTVAGKSEISTTTEGVGAVDTGGTGAYVVTPPSVVHAIGQYFGQNNTAYNLTIVPSRAAGAETIALKTKAGTDPSATDPIYIGFRNVTAGTGDWTYIAITAAESVVIPSTATMGASNSVPFRLRLVGINDGGTFRLGVVNTQTTSGIMALDDDLLLSSTTIGTGSDSAGVIYSDSGVTTKAIRLLGYLDYTLATAGTRDTAPSKIQLFGPGIKKPGDIVQVAASYTGATATGTTQSVADDTIPQNTEGDEYITQAVTPTSSINKLLVETQVLISTDGAGATFVTALHQDSTADALVAGVFPFAAANRSHAATLNHLMRSGTTSATTFKVRVGSTSAGTTRLNGQSGARLLGGVSNSYLKITEIMV